MSGRPPGSPGLLYRLALRLAPARFREHFGQDMYAVYRQARMRARRNGSPWSGTRVGVFFALDVVWTILTEWRVVMGQGMGHRTEFFDRLRADVGFALRGFRRRPGFTATLVLTFALGVGANASIFQVFDALLLSPLPFPESNRLVAVWHTLPGRDKAQVGPATYLDWREQGTSLESLALIEPVSMALTGDDDPVQVPGAQVSANFFDVLEVSPRFGRGFSISDETDGAPAVAVLGHGLWMRRFGGDEGIVGQTIHLAGERTEVVGVAPEGFALDFGEKHGVWSVMRFGEQERQLRGTFHYLFGRLRDGAAPGDAQVELAGILDALVASGEAPTNEGWGVQVVPLKDEIVGDVGRTLAVLMGAVLLVMLVGCANVASLTLARSTTRVQELTLRVALGASRVRLSTQLLVESVVVALFGGVVGLALASFTTSALLASAPESLPRLHEVGLDGRVLLFVFGLTMVAGLTTGLVPALSRSDLGAAAALRAGGPRGPRSGTSRLLGGLVVTESALVVLLLVGSGLLAKSFHELSTVDPGFDTGPGLVVGIELPATRYPDYATVAGFTTGVEERLRASPGVAAVGVTTHVPTRGGFQLFYQAEGHPETAEPGQQKLARFEAVGIGYLEVLGARLESGRTFDATDVEGGPRVLVINRTMADLLWPGEDPLGKEIVLGPSSHRVVGVIADVRHHRLDVDPEPQFYLPDTQMGFLWPTRDLLIRPTGDDPVALAGVVRSVLAEIDPGLPTAYMGTMDDVMGEAVSDARFRVRLLGLLAVVAMILGGIGVYGVVNFTTGWRTREMAIRQSLGAGGARVVRLLVATGLVPLAIGVMIGLTVAFAVAPRFVDLLFRVDARDATVFGGTSLFLLGVGLAASLPAAWKVLRVRPVEALSAD